jgi:thymidylate synthase (FAD)
MRKEVEEIVGKCFPVLDDGFVMLVDVMGSDEAIEQAARISYGEGTRPVNKTRGLIRYLLRQKHTTPFEQVELKFMIRIPMDAWRQMVRHRTANINEYSTRYSNAIDSQQKVPFDQWRLQAKNNKQGSSGFLTDWPEDLKDEYLDKSLQNGHAPRFSQGPGQWLVYMEHYLHKFAKDVYDERIKFGVAKEQARKDLPLSTYTEAYWKVDLHNLFHFLKLRCDSHAQLEIRSFANVIAGMVQRVAPLAFDAWVDYSFCADNFTRLDKQLLYYIDSSYGDDSCSVLDYISKHQYDYPAINEYAESVGMSKREIEEFWKKIKPVEIPNFDLDLSSSKDVSNWHVESTETNIE